MSRSTRRQQEVDPVHHRFNPFGGRDHVREHNRYLRQRELEEGEEGHEDEEDEDMSGVITLESVNPLASRSSRRTNSAQSGPRPSHQASRSSRRQAEPKPFAGACDSGNRRDKDYVDVGSRRGTTHSTRRQQEDGQGDRIKRQPFNPFGGRNNNLDTSEQESEEDKDEDPVEDPDMTSDLPLFNPFACNTAGRDGAFPPRPARAPLAPRRSRRKNLPESEPELQSGDEEKEENAVSLRSANPVSGGDGGRAR